MIKFVILDVYPNKKHRLIKDTAGGYGTGNDFGNTLFSKLLNVYVDTNIGMPAIEIMIISSILKNKHEVHYTRDLNDKEIDDCDFVILPSSIIAHETELEALSKLRHKKIFVTGIFATTKREKYLVENSIVVKNESDTFFYNLEKSNNFNLNFLNQLFDKKNLINDYYTPVELDDFPYPDWGSYTKKFPLRNDFFSLNQRIAIPLLGTRGCPYSCFFYCTYPLQQGRKVRARSVENIVEEIKYWKKELGTNKFVFRDPVFSINRKHTIAFCKKVIEEKLDITFMVETHLNNLDDEMIPLLRKAGLELVYVGVESSSHFVLKDMQRFTVEHDKQYKVIKSCEEAGIRVKTMFIIGNPEDNKDTIVQSIEYAKYLPSLYSQFSVFTPYPGTPAYNEFKDIIIESKLENFNQYNLTFKHKNLSKKNISDLKSLAYFKFYFNFKKIFQILKYFLKSKYEKRISGWGRNIASDANISFPKNLKELKKEIKKNCIARGLGRSYGDSSIQPNKTLVTTKLNNIINFNKKTGILESECGVSIKQLNEIIINKGWFLPVTPGSKNITLGGMIAANVHGKNHHKVGGFGKYVISFKILDNKNRLILCSRKKNNKLFNYTIGGMGLTGVIYSSKIKLKKIFSDLIYEEKIKCNNLKETLSYINKSKNWEYNVSWIDTSPSDNEIGRSIVSRGHFYKAKKKNIFNYSAKEIFTLPNIFPFSLLNRFIIKILNTLYFNFSKSGKNLTSINEFFYPLDKIKNSNNIYGKKGFISYQVSVPFKNAYKSIFEILTTMKKYKAYSFVSVLKSMKKKDFPLSFGQNGFTLVFDFPNYKDIKMILDKVDDIVLKYNGKIYLVKDSIIEKEKFRHLNSEFYDHEFVKLRKKSNYFFNSLQSKRLEL